MHGETPSLCPLSSGCEQRVGASRSPGYLIIGHGTRSDAGTQEFLETVELLRARVMPSPVEPCFLELQSPSIETAWERLLKSGIDAIRAVPMLLFAAGHAKQDIPAALSHCCASYRADQPVCFSQSPPLQCHPKLLELSAKRLDASLQSSGDLVDRSRTAIILAGRGSLDESATSEMYRFSELRGQHERVAVVRTGFLAMARPKLADVIGEVGNLRDIDTVIVQPHLLFQGDLQVRVARLVDEARKQFSDRQWILVDHLGPDPLLAEAIVSLAECHTTKPSLNPPKPRDSAPAPLR